MEIRRIILILALFFIGLQIATADDIPMQSVSAQQENNTAQTETSLQNALINPQNVDFSKCCASFELPPEKLFYLAISAINANNFEIEEIQSKMGYILFRAVNKSFLVSISKENDAYSMIKITPADNIYFFPYGVVYNIFYYIDLNKSEPLEKF